MVQMLLNQEMIIRPGSFSAYLLTIWVCMLPGAVAFLPCLTKRPRG